MHPVLTPLLLSLKVAVCAVAISLVLGVLCGFLLARCPAPGDALRAHQADSQRLPARFADGRLRAGYLSLVPVTPASLFRAFIEVV